MHRPCQPTCPLPAAPAQGEPGQDAAAGRELIAEVCEVVEQNFSDARNAGYDRQAWAALKERALARPLRDRTAAYGCAGPAGWEL